jgi:hypothetical protein
MFLDRRIQEHICPASAFFEKGRCRPLRRSTGGTSNSEVLIMVRFAQDGRAPDGPTITHHRTIFFIVPRGSLSFSSSPSYDRMTSFPTLRSEWNDDS